MNGHLYNLSFTYLAMKEFKLGFDLYENRLRFNNINKQHDGFHQSILKVIVLKITLLYNTNKFKITLK